MSDDDDAIYSKMINDLYEYHDQVNNGTAHQGQYNLTPTGMSILDDVEAFLMSEGPLAEELFTLFFSELAKKKLGSHLTKAND